MRFLSLVVLAFFVLSPAAKAETLEMKDFARLPVQYDGRIEPLDSFARTFLNTFSGKSSIDQMDADQWLAELLFDPDRAYQRAVFNIANPQVRRAFDLPEMPHHRYTFPQIASAMEGHQDMVQSLLAAKDKKITDPAQSQALDLYTNMLWYFELSRSLSLVLPVFEIEDRTLAKKIGLEAGHPVPYLEMLRHRPAYLKQVLPVLDRYRKQSHPDQRQASLLKIGLLLKHMEADRQTKILRVMPPVWSGGGDQWLSPWAVFNEGQGSPRTAGLMQSWSRMAEAYGNHDSAGWRNESAALLRQTLAIAGPKVRPYALEAEYIYNQTHLFACSLAFYLAGFAVFLAFLRLPHIRGLYHFSCALLGFGVLTHLAGLSIRVFVLQRPPVGTLYESIIFVGLIAVIGCALLELKNRRGLGLGLALLSGIILQTVGMAFASDGDTMGTLVAVLNTNFWLATHVTAITTGYGCCMITGLLGHVWLAQRILKPSDNGEALLRLICISALVALFFAATGTVLGGIWADQSWGRFWGWDPKENGALLIVLWLLWILHARLAGLFGDTGFAVGAALTIIVVAISWFGVNLLNVGLHSYGFTSGIALNLFLFIVFELGLIGSGFFLARKAGQRA